MANAVETLIRSTVTKGVLKIADFNRARTKAPREPHMFLNGLHAPMTAELTITDLKVTGTIPPELNGRYLRNGPNPVTPPNPATYHWFTGTGMVHGVRIEGGQALWYRNRWIRGAEVSAALGEPSAPGVKDERFDAPNTNVVGHAGSTWAIVESVGIPVRIDDMLGTIAHDPFGGTLKGPFSAHPHLDQQTGELHAICYDAMDQHTIHHVIVDARGKVRREEPIAVQDGPSIHDCMITKNFVIILDLPVTFSMKKLLAGHNFPYKWNPDHKARVGLLPREGKGSETIWCEVAPCYVFHPCNGFEADDGTITLDVCVHDTMFAESTQGPDSQQVTFERWTITPATQSIDRAIIDKQGQEFPRHDERLTGKTYRYAYTVPFPAGSEDFVAETYLIKHDLKAGARQTHQFGAHRHPGEFVFVPQSPDAAEDEGWLMGYVIDANNETTDLVIINAQDFSGPPQAIITIPHRIPPGFHGNWVGD
ncbi:MAG: carotenoid oxygenase family protein [Sphingopyxis sp.]